MNPHQNPNDNNEEMEVLAPGALESLERASVDIQISTAHKFPRSLEKFKKRAMDMVQQDVETAESCIYYRPVGKGDDGKQKMAEGASIRMAEIVAACYGNIRFGARIIEQTDRYVKAQGVAHDLEANTFMASEAMESTVDKYGKPYSERMRIVVGKATLSKALRDAIFRVVPRALCKSVYDAAKKVIAGQSKTLDQRRESAKSWIASLKVEEARVFDALDVKGWSEVGEEQLLILTGIKTGLRDKETTLEEAFPPIEKPEGESSKPADVSDLGPVTPKKAAEKKPAEKPASKPAEGTEAPTCAYCHQPTSADHTCEGLQKAIAATEPAAGEDAYTALTRILGANEITPEQCLAYAKQMKLAKDHKKLSELSSTKLVQIAKSLAANPKIIDEIKAVKL